MSPDSRVESEMDTQLRKLVEQLSEVSPANDISDADIQAEIDAVRREHN
jgi:hypothetical protein